MEVLTHDAQQQLRLTKGMQTAKTAAPFTAGSQAVLQHQGLLLMAVALEL